MQKSIIILSAIALLASIFGDAGRLQANVRHDAANLAAFYAIEDTVRHPVVVTADNHKNYLDSLLLNGQYDELYSFFEKEIVKNPNHAARYSERAVLKEMLGDKFGALRDHDKAIEIEPDNFVFYVRRGRYNANSGYPFLALSDLTKAIELAPENGYPYFEIANIYFSQKNLEEALLYVNKAIERDSTQSSFYTGRGAIYEVMEAYREAINDYTKAISLDRDDELPYRNRAGLFYKLEELAAACTDFLTLKSFIENRVITDSSIIKEVNATIQDICEPSNPSYYYQRGVAYFNLKEYLQALDVYTKGLTLFPDNAMLLSFKGNACLALGEYDKAIEFYNLSLKYKENLLTELRVNPRFTNASNKEFTSYYDGLVASIYYSLAECKVDLGHFDPALADIHAALELAPDMKDFNKETFYNLRGYIYLMKGNYERAITDFNRSIQINKNFPLPYVNRAVANVSLVSKIKFNSYAISGYFNNQPVMNINWNPISKSTLKKSEATFLSALSDCDKAIEYDSTLGFAYYIRGHIKQILNYDDSCPDLLAARELGLTVEEALIRNCEHNK